MRKILLGGISFFTLVNSFAADITWSGGGGASNEWNNTANWSGGVVPEGADVAVFNATTTVSVAAQTINVQGIRIATAATVTLSGTATSFTIGSSGINLTYATGTGALANGNNAISLNGSVVFTSPSSNPRLNITGAGKVTIATTSLQVGIAGGTAGPTLQVNNLELNNAVTFTVAGQCNLTVVNELSLLGTSKLILPYGGGATRNFTLGATGGSGIISGTGTLSVGSVVPANPPAIIIAVGTSSDVGILRFSDLPTTAPSNIYVNRFEIFRSGCTIGIDANVVNSIFAISDIRTAGSPAASGTITINGGNNLSLRVIGQNAFNSASTTTTNIVYNSSNKITYARSASPWSLTAIGISTPESSITLNVPELELATTGTAPRQPSFSINGNTILNGRLSFTTTQQVLTNGRLVIGSSGAIDNLSTSSSSVSGDVIVQKIIPAGRRRNIFLSSAVTARIDTSWQQQMHITGSGTGGTICPTFTAHTNGFDATLNNTASMFTYNPTAAAGSRWVSVANTNATNLTPGTGYRMIFRGNRTQGCSLLDGSNTTAQATTLSAKGVLAQGNISVTLQPGFNLLGNPYPSPLNFATVQSDNTTNIENNYWAYFAPANAATPNYSVYSAGDTSNFPTAYANPGILASGQAVFVKTKPAVVSATVVSNFFRETQKSSTTQNGQFRVQNTWLGRVRTQLVDTDGSIVDAALVRFSNHSDVNNLIIGALDAQSLNSSALHISTIKAGERFSIQTRTEIAQQGDTVTLFVHAANSGTYQLRFSELQIGSNNAILIDKFSNQQQAISEGDGYSFTTTNDPASKGNRFDIVFRSSATLPTNFTAIYAKAKQDNKAADVIWTVGSDKQVVSYTVERSTDGRNYKAVGSVASQQSNQAVSYSYTDNQAITTVVYYRVKATAADGSYKYSAVAKLNGKASSIELSLYPNPVQSQLSVQLSQPVKGQIAARVVDSKGQVVYQQSGINLAGSNLLQLSVAHLPQGTYQLTLTNGSDFTATGSFVK